jgi:carboxymethylenebutenolidase
MGRSVSFNRPDGQALSGYLAEPAQPASAPGLVVIQEWWGLNDQIRGVADRMAAAGYRALVPDLYRGKSTVEAEEAHHLLRNNLKSSPFRRPLQQERVGSQGPRRGV